MPRYTDCEPCPWLSHKQSLGLSQSEVTSACQTGTLDTGGIHAIAAPPGEDVCHRPSFAACAGVPLPVANVPGSSGIVERSAGREMVDRNLETCSFG